MTVSEVAAVRVADVPVPTTVGDVVPAAVEIDGDTVIVAEPPASTVDGLNEAAAPSGSPVAVRVTGWLDATGHRRADGEGRGDVRR